MSPSRDMTRKVETSAVLPTYYRLTAAAVTRIEILFKVCMPLIYERYRDAFRAGVWLRADSGPWIGRAIVYKLDVELHRDALDEGPAAIFPVGNFTGGNLFFPDIGLKFRYSTGHVCICQASALYHKVGTWSPSGEVSSSNITPGRIGHVLFMPKRTYDALQGKEPGWFIRTAGGRVSDPTEDDEDLTDCYSSYHCVPSDWPAF
ncbi:hypothetical protein BKA62DRAFT_626045 [Auriculariales sp. MPI-PUGE-AT-0066]|nr:hypothetical protein BKA62DRAFT_626045 [Auriculariales sp. MPI-PUGE-AT-0066]